MTTNIHSQRHAVIEKYNKRCKELAEANHALECLYDIEKCFSAAPTSAASYQCALDRIEHLLGFSGAAICLNNARQQAAVMLASTPSETGARMAFCQTRNCRACLGGRRLHEVRAAGGARVLQVPLVTRKSRYGVLSIRLPENRALSSREHATLGTLGARLALFAEAAELRVEAERRALQEERMAIARDLHDSLAHTLAYLKIQLLRLRSRLGMNGQAGGLDEVITELAQGLTDANAQVRELITTFRLSLPQGGFESAVTHVAGQVAARSKLNVRVRNGVPASLLTANEQINVVQILKESLVNVERHASAGSVWVRLHLKNDDILAMEIEDDGIGLPPGISAGRRGGRYGLGIMRERARILGGKIRFARRQPTGTTVVLAFMPESCKSHSMPEAGSDEQQRT